MTNSIARSKSSIVSIALIAAAVLGVAGAVYSRFPPGWFSPVDLGSMLSAVEYIVSQTFGATYLVVLLLAVIAILVVSKDRKLPTTILLPLMPLLPLSLMLLWGSYCHCKLQSNVGIDHWTVGVAFDLISIFVLTFIGVLIVVFQSKHWKGFRIFAIFIMAIEFVMSIGITLMEVSYSMGF